MVRPCSTAGGADLVVADVQVVHSAALTLRACPRAAAPASPIPLNSRLKLSSTALTLTFFFADNVAAASSAAGNCVSRGASNFTFHQKKRMRRPICLPRDVVDMIVEHACAMRIQGAFVRRKFRHARLARFAPLRRRLLAALDLDELNDLSSSALVRREWRCEPQSWIDEFDADQHTLHTLVAEVRSGLWSALS